MLIKANKENTNNKNNINENTNNKGKKIKTKLQSNLDVIFSTNEN